MSDRIYSKPIIRMRYISRNLNGNQNVITLFLDKAKYWYTRYILYGMGTSRPYIFIRKPCPVNNYIIAYFQSIQMVTTKVRILKYTIWQGKCVVIVSLDSVARFSQIRARDASRKSEKGNPVLGTS